jgi:acetolactate synthase small subunit
MLEKCFALIKISLANPSRDEIVKLVGIFRAIIIDISHDSMIVEIT